MPDHSGVPLDARDALGRNAEAVGRWLEPRPLRRLGKSSHHVLDSGRHGQNQQRSDLARAVSSSGTGADGLSVRGYRSVGGVPSGVARCSRRAR